MTIESATSSGRSAPSICVVLAYLGRLPTWFDLWLHTAAHNRDINWLVATDDSADRFNVPPNVRWFTTSLADVNRRARERVDPGASLPHAYKLCDYKPAYGLLFEEALAGYDLWGHCDPDVIWGDLRRFLPADVLRAHGKVLIRGHLSLYRNDDEFRNVFRLTTPQVDFRRVMADPRAFAFDEWAGLHKILVHHRIPFFDAEFVADIRPEHHDLRMTKLPNFPRQVFWWERGRVVQEYVDGAVHGEREVAYIHLQKRRMERGTFDPGESFYVLPDRFAPRAPGAAALAAAEIARLNPRRPIHDARWALRAKWRGLKRRLG